MKPVATEGNRHLLLVFSCFSGRGRKLTTFPPTFQTGVFICACVVIDRKQDGYVAHMWEMFRQGSRLSVYSPALSGKSDAN